MTRVRVQASDLFLNLNLRIFGYVSKIGEKSTGSCLEHIFVLAIVYCIISHIACYKSFRNGIKKKNMEPLLSTQSARNCLSS